MDLSKIDISKQKDSSSAQQQTISTSRYTSSASAAANKVETNKNDDDFFNVKSSGSYSLKGGGNRIRDFNVKEELMRNRQRFWGVLFFNCGDGARSI